MNSDYHRIWSIKIHPIFIVIIDIQKRRREDHIYHDSIFSSDVLVEAFKHTSEEEGKKVSVFKETRYESDTKSSHLSPLTSHYPQCKSRKIFTVICLSPILKEACSQEDPRAQFAFKDLMIHWILQFALHIAFRCVLHRGENQDIHC